MPVKRLELKPATSFGLPVMSRDGARDVSLVGPLPVRSAAAPLSVRRPLRWLRWELTRMFTRVALTSWFAVSSAWEIASVRRSSGPLLRLPCSCMRSYCLASAAKRTVKISLRLSCCEEVWGSKLSFTFRVTCFCTVSLDTHEVRKFEFLILTGFMDSNLSLTREVACTRNSRSLFRSMRMAVSVKFLTFLRPMWSLRFGLEAKLPNSSLSDPWFSDVMTTAEHLLVFSCPGVCAELRFEKDCEKLGVRTPVMPLDRMLDLTDRRRKLRSSSVRRNSTTG
mmetsp:Transcript_62773/g.192012  ORF Transcript_62773/g.192012 Transcript_62773/m.192012 type:complete len:280 (-) Transcript_62773:1418-2257(-)